MFKSYALMMLITAIAAAGCGSSQPATDSAAKEETKSAPSPADGRKPDEVVRIFFEGLRSGDEAKIHKMLTAKARANDLINAEPRNASFQIGEVRYLNDVIAHVPSVWTFFDESGQKIGTDDAIWALRLQPEGWRIAGTVMQVPDLGKMVALDFEDKEAYENIKRQVEAEIATAHEGGDAVGVARRDIPAPKNTDPNEGVVDAKDTKPQRTGGKAPQLQRR
jgi:hypothetical protein